ncbi:adult-specific cuticular protein ACP-20-like [Sitophilus oryzae]|uniref:Adult-specific cuticular protein ACP-20-like n=1 Tax=Sitophilus oryzae TaxID=7048 RepID=A0A6J2X9B2_SITOR|nr:adult-specific cuticular protein ACP-20-like [Sitophilus oryzae]
MCFSTLVPYMFLFVGILEFGGYSQCSSINKGYYSFQYAIDMEDILSQHSEEGRDSVAKGSYSFLQPDGLIRTVQYQVDGQMGFKAIVKYSKIRNNLRGPLRFPRDFLHPLYFFKPLSFVPLNVLKSSKFKNQRH